jgi:hypothetical protein
MASKKRKKLGILGLASSTFSLGRAFGEGAKRCSGFLHKLFPPKHLYNSFLVAKRTHLCKHPGILIVVALQRTEGRLYLLCNRQCWHQLT